MNVPPGNILALAMLCAWAGAANAAPLRSEVPALLLSGDVHDGDTVSVNVNAAGDGLILS
mgnify:CR=1 FL=1